VGCFVRLLPSSQRAVGCGVFCEVASFVATAVAEAMAVEKSYGGRWLPSQRLLISVIHFVRLLRTSQRAHARKKGPNFLL
jgi:hypothetical protein